MSIELLAIILVGGLFLLLALGVEIAIAMGVLASLAFVFFISQPQMQIPWTAWSVVNSFSLLAMTFFIFMGTMFANTGVVRSLFDGAEKWITGLPGGLASAVIAANAVFGALSGSSVAAVATFGTIVFPEMEKRGYDPKLALGSITSGGTLSVLIPPSIIFIVYGVWESISVARLFAAGMIPGILLAVLLMATAMVMAIRNPRLAPKSPPVPWKEKLAAIKDLLPWIGVIALVLGVIFGGIMTPTESSALGAFLSIVIALGYRQMSYKALKASFLDAAMITAMISFLMITARLLAFVFQAAGLTEAFSALILNLPLGKYGVLTFLVIMYLILGCFLDSMSMMLLTLPFVMPVLSTLGLDPIWWGVVYVVLAEIGLVTPPFGLNLFTMQGVVPKYSILTIAESALPFLIPMLLVIALLIAFPDLALWLPGILYR
jgi:tripartite ATP-independent transporter DctM subunit